MTVRHTADWIPKQYHDQQITALTDRCVLAEAAVVDLLNLIDEDVLKRHLYDWLAAVKELVA
jgi:hypothetical protein